MQHIIRQTALMLLAAVTTATAAAQVQADTAQAQAGRKKVAVVLSGGGAKGMAHIGALKVIERAGIPIDIVTGTSMGSIVGGLYAIGYNAQMLDSLVRVQDWSYVISDREDLSRQSLGDREKQNTYILSRGLTVGRRSESTGGLISGKNLAALFQKLCTGYLDSIDFNRLPIPFACVATDIIDNTEYDFHSGRLPQAMRASMAIPAAFTPVRIGNRVLVDGGLRNNYPADIAREMGADIIIGVTVQGAPKTADDMGNAISILSQIIDVNCKNKYDENLAITDVPIRVNTSGYNAASFTPSAIDTLIRRGEEEALRHWDELTALKARIGIGPSFSPERLTPFRPTALSERVKVTAFAFENISPTDEHFIREKFRLNRADSIDARGEESIATAMRIDLFYQTVDVREEPQADGFRIVFTAGSKKTSQLNVGFRFDTEEMVALQLNADMPLKSRHPVDLDLTLRLGKRTKARADLTFHPRSFTRPVISYTFSHNDRDIFYRGRRDYSIIYNQHTAELAPINLNIRNFNVKGGLRWDYFYFHDRLKADPSAQMELGSKHYLSYRMTARYDSENDWHFPTRGARFKAEYVYLTDNMARLDGHRGMSEVNARWRMSFALNSRLTVQPMAYGRLLFGSSVPSVFNNVVGGEWFGHYVEQQMPFAGVGNMEHTDRHFAALQLQAQQRIATNNYVLLRLAAAQHADRLGSLADHHTLLGCQAAYYYDTMFGPAGASLGFSNKTHKPSFFINLGFEF